MSVNPEFFDQFDEPVLQDGGAVASEAAQPPADATSPIAQPPGTPPAEAAAPDNAPAPTVPASADPASSAPADRTVPLEAHIAERRKLQAQLAEAREEGAREFQAMQRRIAELEAKIQGAAPAPAPETPAPDFLEDPKGYVDTAVSRIEKAAKEAAERAGKIETQTQEQVQIQQFFGAIQTDERQFLQQSPDYPAALEHLRAQRINELKLFLPDASDEQIRQQVAGEELALAAQALQRRTSPAALAYQYALARGYRKAADTTPAPAAGTAPAPSGPPPAAAAAAMTLGASGGSPVDASPTDQNTGLEDFDQALREAFGRK